MAQVVVQQLDGRQVEVADIDPGASMQAVDNPQFELLVQFPSEPMNMWPISSRVNKPANDDPTLLDPLGPDGPTLL